MNAVESQFPTQLEIWRNQKTKQVKKWCRNGEEMVQFSLLLFIPLRCFELNQTSLHVRACGRDFFSSQQILERIFQIRMARFLLLAPITELVVNGPAIKHCPRFGLDTNSFGGASSPQRASDLL